MRTSIEIKGIDLWSLFKVSFLLYAVLGLILGILYGILMLVAGGLQSAFLGDEWPRFGLLGGILGIVLIPLMAVLYGVIGSVFATIGGAVFNLIAGFAGGIRFHTDDGTATPQPGAETAQAAPAQTSMAPDAEETT
jgi:hypothetical protein